jgi:uncharacterized Ntn-hydrolase superfamily protein
MKSTDMSLMQLATFSIVARSNRDREFGVASATAAPCVGALLPHAAEGVGSIATQAWVNVNLGYHGIKLMRSGLSVGAALSALLSEDKGKEKRQVIGVDKDSVFGFTGRECGRENGHVLGKDFAVAGNILASEMVLEAMVTQFRTSKGELGDRMLSALEAGQKAGGDSRGKTSAVLLIASPKPHLWHDLRVDMHTTPLEELRKLYRTVRVLDEELADEEGGEILKVHGIRD